MLHFFFPNNRLKPLNRWLEFNTDLVNINYDHLAFKTHRWTLKHLDFLHTPRFLIFFVCLLNFNMCYPKYGDCMSHRFDNIENDSDDGFWCNSLARPSTWILITELMCSETGYVFWFSMLLKLSVLFCCWSVYLLNKTKDHQTQQFI